MDNYNFTKGKWKNSDIRVISYNEEKKVSEQVCQCFIMTFKHDSIGKRIEDVEGKANALLISKAPEMLDMLIKCKMMCDHLNIHHVSNELNTLIKEATEL